MAAFEYEALDAAGKRRRGVISADSPRLARRELKRLRLLPLRVETARGRRSGRLAARRAESGRLPAKQLALLTRQFATMAQAAAPVEEILQTVAAQTDRLALRKTLLAVRGHVMEGQRLSDAMAREGRAFPPLYRAMVRAGETSGSLAPVLERLADHLEKSQKLRAKLITALVYPAMLAIVAAAVIIALMTFVIPKVVEQFDSLGGTLPGLTRAMIALSNAMRDHGVTALVLLAVAGVVFAHSLRRPAFRLAVDRMLLRLPLLGRLLRDLASARLARTLASLVASGVPVLEALVAAQGTVFNQHLKAALAQAAVMVGEGASLSQALRKTALFSPMIVYMTAVGESSGRIDHMLDKAADHLEAEFESFTATALSLLEPAIIVVMGGIVMLIVLAILLPILQLNTLALG